MSGNSRSRSTLPPAAGDRIPAQGVDFPDWYGAAEPSAESPEGGDGRDFAGESAGGADSVAAPEGACAGHGEKEKHRHDVFSQAVKRALRGDGSRRESPDRAKGPEKCRSQNVLTAQELKFLLG